MAGCVLCDPFMNPSWGDIFHYGKFLISYFRTVFLTMYIIFSILRSDGEGAGVGLLLAGKRQFLRPLTLPRPAGFQAIRQEKSRVLTQYDSGF